MPAVPKACLQPPGDQAARGDSGVPQLQGDLSCWAHSCHELPVPSPAPWRDSSATGEGWGRQGWGEAGWDLPRAQLCTHSDQLMMFPMTRSTIRSCRRGGAVRGWGKLLWGGCQGGSLQSRGPRASTHHVHGPAALPHAVRVQHVQDPAQDARVCGDRGRDTGGPPHCPLPPRCRCPPSPSFQRPM